MDGDAGTVLDIYDALRGGMAGDARWSTPISEIFNQQYAPGDVPCDQIIADFARENAFDMCDMTDKLSNVVTMADLVKLYSTCSKLAIAKPKMLFFVLAKLQAPRSMSVLEGLFALRAALIAGNLSVFFRERKNVTKKEKQLMRTRAYDLCLFQSDNIVLLSNNTADEMRRKLNDLVAECSICLEPLTDVKGGSIVYPFRCEHSFHSSCAQECHECPLCRNSWAAKRTVFELRHEKR